MGYNLRNRNLMSLLDFCPREIRYLLDLAATSRPPKYGGYEQEHMRGKNIASSSRRPRPGRACRSKSPPTTRAPT